MALFQGSNDGYWFWITILVTVMMGAAIWFVVMIGRERNAKQDAGNATSGKYLDLEENHAPVSKFLIITFVGTALWGLGYLVWTGLNGVTGF